MGKAYGAVDMNVFVITSSIVVTMVMPDGEEITQSRRLLGSGSVDFSKVERLNQLCENYCNDKFSIFTLKTELKKIKQNFYPDWMYYAGGILAAGSFAMFFKGTFLDGICAAIGAIIICLMNNYMGRLSPNVVTMQLLCSLVTGLFIGSAASIYPELHADKVMIGDIMLLIPGIAMTNAVRDILVGDTIAGLLRFIESFLWAGALAGGFMCSMLILEDVF